jgi:hypothetical protein
MKDEQFISANTRSDAEESKALINVSNARRSQGCGKVAYGSGGYPGAKNSNRVCTYCGKDNHIVEKCYTKPGFPSNFGQIASAS